MKAIQSAPLIAQGIGPFPGNQKPVRKGLYLRESPDTGLWVWAYWDGQWYGYADTSERAASKYKRGKRSKYASLRWYAKPKS